MEIGVHFVNLEMDHTVQCYSVLQSVEMQILWPHPTSQRKYWGRGLEIWT